MRLFAAEGLAYHYFIGMIFSLVIIFQHLDQHFVQ